MHPFTVSHNGINDLSVNKAFAYYYYLHNSLNIGNSISQYVDAVRKLILSRRTLSY